MVQARNYGFLKLALEGNTLVYILDTYLYLSGLKGVKACNGSEEWMDDGLIN